VRKLLEWYPGEWKLVYQASRDGFSAESFHQKCDGQGVSIVVVKSTKGNLFGGYTSKGWTSTRGSVSDPKATLFTLLNPQGIAPSVFPLSPNGVDRAIFCDPNFGPTFGSSAQVAFNLFALQTPEQYDLRISNNCYANQESVSSFPQAYLDGTGRGLSLDGARNFTVLDYVVFCLNK
jgi:hypothetical protein